MLPADFRDLERHVERWVVPTDEERIKLRMESSVEEVTSFYQALLPRFPEVMTHLGGVDPRQMSEEDHTLFGLAVAFVEMCDTVELYAPTGSSGPKDIVRISHTHGLLGLAHGEAA